MLFIPGASHLHQFRLLVVADIKRAERVSRNPASAEMFARAVPGTPRHPHQEIPPMAARVLNRRALREQGEQDEPDEQDEETTPADESPAAGAKARKARTRKAAAAKPAKAKAPAKPRVRKKAVKVQPRMFARWVVFDNSMKRVAVFEYKDRAGADEKLVEALERKPGAYFLLMVKDPYDPPAEAGSASPA